MSVFVDTSAFMAVLNADEEMHPAAEKIWTHLISSRLPLVVSNYILVETFALVQSRLGMEAVRNFQDDVYPLLRVEWVDEATHRAGAAAVLSAGRRRLSLVDCVSFEVMRRLGLRCVFCFDPHFEEQGFERLTVTAGSSDE